MNGPFTEVPFFERGWRLRSVHVSCEGGRICPRGVLEITKPMELDYWNGIGTGIVGTIGYVVLPTGVSTDVSRDIVWRPDKGRTTTTFQLVTETIWSWELSPNPGCSHTNWDSNSYNAQHVESDYFVVGTQNSTSTSTRDREGWTLLAIKNLRHVPQWEGCVAFLLLWPRLERL